MSIQEVEQKQQQLNDKIKQRKIKTMVAHAVLVGIGVASVATNSLLMLNTSEAVFGIVAGAGVAILGEKFVSAYNNACKQNEKNEQNKIDVSIRRNRYNFSDKNKDQQNEFN